METNMLDNNRQLKCVQVMPIPELPNLDDYVYTLPPELIAEKQVVPRDSSKLLVYYTETDTIEDRIFSELPDILPSKTLIVRNQTRVIPARLQVYRSTGGRVEMLFLLNEPSHPHLLALANRKLKIGTQIYREGKVLAQVIGKSGNKYLLEWLCETPLFAMLEENGEIPIPRYIKSNTQSEQEKRTNYQSVFASNSGELASVAAPTASLHFTKALLQKLQQHHLFVDVELSIGMGTFDMITQDNFVSKKLHSEHISIPELSFEKLNNSEHLPILAVGTTAARTLESLDCLHHNKDAWSGWTDIFIYPGKKLQKVDYLLTNFHVPRSSLLLLVEAFLQQKKSRRSVIQIYEYAISQNYRFYSFGDAMLIL